MSTSNCGHFQHYAPVSAMFLNYVHKQRAVQIGSKIVSQRKALPSDTQSRMKKASRSWLFGFWRFSDVSLHVEPHYFYSFVALPLSVCGYCATTVDFVLRLAISIYTEVLSRTAKKNPISPYWLSIKRFAARGPNAEPTL